MGLYLCISQPSENQDEDPEEIDGVAVGAYSDFADFRDTVLREVENGAHGSLCPVLQLHSDCDGEWSPDECVRLRAELARVKRVFLERPARPPGGWQAQVIAELRLPPRQSLFDSFIDPDGQPLVDRLDELCAQAIRLQLPISFQ